MRIRGVLTAAAAALLLTACASTSGPTSGDDTNKPEQAATKHNLRVELDAQMHDPCFRNPTKLEPPQCQKYITQLTSTPDTARELARNNPALAEAAEHLGNGIKEYRSHSCAAPAPDQEQTCTEALVTIADALRELEQTLDNG